jgi:hypothetical protein
MNSSNPITTVLHGENKVSEKEKEIIRLQNLIGRYISEVKDYEGRDFLRDVYLTPNEREELRRYADAVRAAENSPELLELLR